MQAREEANPPIICKKDIIHQDWMDLCVSFTFANDGGGALFHQVVLEIGCDCAVKNKKDQDSGKCILAAGNLPLLMQAG